MKLATLALIPLLFAGCATTSPEEHQAHVNALRARLPYVTHIGLTHSMATVLDSGTIHMVEAKPYDKVQTGDMVVFWPAGWWCPVAHFVGDRIGTDSWSTHGMNQDSDLTNGLGFLLTRENYIGVIK